MISSGLLPKLFQPVAVKQVWAVEEGGLLEKVAALWRLSEQAAELAA